MSTNENTTAGIPALTATDLRTIKAPIHNHMSLDDKRKIDRLLVEYKRDRNKIKNMEDETQLMNRVRKKLGSEDLVDQWLDERLKYLEDELKPPTKHKTTQMNTNHFKNILNHADWNDATNPDWKYVDSWLRYSTERSPIPLGVFHGFWLVLHVDNDAIHPQEADAESLASIGVTTVNPTAILGMQYKKSLKKLRPFNNQTIIVVQFGRIFSTNVPEDKSAIIEESKWHDTGFVLVLEIKDSGKAGEFYIVNNPAYIGHSGEPESYQMNEKSQYLTFCGEQFTVAKIKKTFHFELLKNGWKMEEILIERESDIAPNFLESGIKVKDGKNERLVATFLRERRSSGNLSTV